MITIGRTKENFLLISPLTGKLEMYLQSLWNTSLNRTYFFDLFGFVHFVSSVVLLYYIPRTVSRFGKNAHHQKKRKRNAAREEDIN